MAKPNSGRGETLRTPRRPKEVPVQYRGLSSRDRYEVAGRLHLIDGWSQVRAAEETGISRERFNAWLRKDEQANRVRILGRADELDKVARADRLGRHAVILGESRRVGTVHEFVERYFSWMVCPDCNRHHDTPSHVTEILEALQSPDPRVLVNLPPYHSKTTASVMDTVFDIARDPNTRTIVVSKSNDFAKTFVRSVTELLTNRELYGDGPNLVDDWGPFREPGSEWTKQHFYVTGRMSAEKDPTLLALGIGNQIYGRRATKVKGDDMATLDNSRSPARVEKDLEYIDAEMLSRIGSAGKAAFLGTRTSSFDMYSILGRRPGYKVIRFPAIMDESQERTLWPDHFSYAQAIARRAEMKPAHWQLVYQQVALPGQDAPFNPDDVERSKDLEWQTGQYLSDWRLVAGLDLAGGGKGSGYTAGVLYGVDLTTGQRTVVDLFNEKSMRAPSLKAQIFDWTDRYPIRLWKVENNGVQANLVQYNDEIIRVLAQRGVRVEGHNTQSNKWDHTFGVEAMSPLFTTGMLRIPWGNTQSALKFQQLVDQLLVFPMGQYSDLVMALWFAELAVKDTMRRMSLPMFDSRRRVPAEVAARRVVIDFAAGVARPVGLQEQVRGAWNEDVPYRRTMLGRLGRQRPDRGRLLGEDAIEFVNVGQ